MVLTEEVQSTGGDGWIWVYYDGENWVKATDPLVYVGSVNTSLTLSGGGHRFESVQIPKGAIITKAFLRVRAYSGIGALLVKSQIAGEKTVSPAVFSTLENYATRRGIEGYGDGNLTGSKVDWEISEAWSSNEWYESPDIKDMIQEIIDLPDWESGNSIVLFWDDHDGRSNIEYERDIYTYSYPAESPSDAPILHIEWEEAPIPPAPENPITTIVNALISVLSTVWIVLAENAEIIGQCLCMGFMITPLIHLLKKVHKMIDWVKA